MRGISIGAKNDAEARYLPAVARNDQKTSSREVEKSIKFKDGSTLHILKGGKMAMENKLGQAVSMKPGEVMETVDGKKIMMHGNELMRLNIYLQEGKGS